MPREAEAPRAELVEPARGAAAKRAGAGAEPLPAETRGVLADGAWIGGLKLLVSAAILAAGFRAISDDDYARVVIAEAWAHTPRLDPTGTSWLPLPFWVLGGVLRVVGRSLEVARGASVALGVASAVLVYVAARWITASRAASLAGAALAAAFPWSARLGAATVPELPAAALTLLAVASTASASPSRRLAGAAALLAATLCRYEAWPVAVAFAALCLGDAWRAGSSAGASRRALVALLAAAALALAGPALWIAWNHHAHGEALHFFARVSSYRQALGGAGSLGLAARVVAYPAALLRQEPGLVVVVALSLAAARLAREPAVRLALAASARPFLRPTLLVGAQVMALSMALVRDGAPTHHPERAMLLAMLLGAVYAGAMGAELAVTRSPRLRAGMFATAVAFMAVASAIARNGISVDPAGRGDDEALGRAAVARVGPGERVLVEAEGFGHLAFIAAFGRPEDAVVDRSVDPRDAPIPSSFVSLEALRARKQAAGARFAAGRTTAGAFERAEPLVSRGPLGLYDAGEAPQ